MKPLFALGVWLAVLCGLATAESGNPPRRPNVILFLVDDMGWMDSGVYGSTYYETPNIDRLATQAMRFTDAYAHPLCSPTRASILTGQYPSRHRITSASGHQPPQTPGASLYPDQAAPNRALLYADSKNYLEPQLVTLAEVLRDAGYRTAHFGKWHLGLTAEYRPDKHGFETVWHCAPDPGPPRYFSPYGVVPAGTPGGRQRVGNITDGPPGEHITDRMTDEALRYLETNKDRPFYLNFWLYSVHGPWQHKEAYTAQFAQKTDPRGKQRNPVMASMLRTVDESLGRLLAKLDELKLTDDTLFIFYSDNGGNCHSWGMDDAKLRNVTPAHPLYETVQSYRQWAGGEVPTNNDPLREGKGRIYEGGQRVPLLVRWPGQVQAGSTSGAVVGAIDLYPTVLDALGLPQPAGHVVDGVSFLPVLDGAGGLARQAYFTWFPHLVPAVSVRQGDWKLIRRFEPHPQYPEVRELYNLREDLGETKNLAPALPEKVKELDALIEAFVQDTGALYPKPNPDYRPGSAAAAHPGAASTAGLVPKFCKLSTAAGALRVEADGRTPFLGTAQVKAAGPLTLKLRARSAAGGAGKVQWTTQDQAGFPPTGQTVEFTLAAGPQWQDLTVQVPANGVLRIVRLYLPADKSPVEIESIQFLPETGTKPIRAWNFPAARPK